MTQFKKGDMVRIKENAKELTKPHHGWDTVMNKMLGEVCEVEGVDGISAFVYTQNKSDAYRFPFKALELVTEADTSTNLEDSRHVAKNATNQKGFDPENLTFDGVEIKKGDSISICGSPSWNNDFQVFTFYGILSIKYPALILNQTDESKDEVIPVYIPIKRLNITKHIPTKTNTYIGTDPAKEGSERTIEWGLDDEDTEAINVINTDITLPLSAVQSKPVRISGSGSVTITYPENTGFDHENLTFDGVEIKQGDKICLGGYYTEYTVTDVYTIDYHEHVTGDADYIHLVNLNITAHYPAKDKELERLEKEISIVRLQVLKSNDQVEIYELLDKYADLKAKQKELDNYKANNG
jgi:hypothetical protein